MSPSIGSDSAFERTAAQLTQERFSHHESKECMCEECDCGRHLCHFKSVKPDFKKTTIYKQQFDKKAVTPSLVLHAQEYDKLKGPHLDMASTYSKGFGNKKGKDALDRPKPEHLLHSGGPIGELTTYGMAFPGHKGSNQYVKPTDKHIRASFPLRSKSTYSSTFVGKQSYKEDFRYQP